MRKSDYKKIIIITIIAISILVAMFTHQLELMMFLVLVGGIYVWYLRIESYEKYIQRKEEQSKKNEKLWEEKWDNFINKR